MSSDGCNIIEHYQKAIKKARNDERKLLHCIGKLDALPITIDHLQMTGVGKTVNSLRKYDGLVGDAAKELVSKWKNMVATGESASPSPEREQNGHSAGGIESEYSLNDNIELKDGDTRLTNNGKHREENRHSDRKRDSNYSEEKKQSSSQKDSSRREEKRQSNCHKDSNQKEEKRQSDKDSQKDSNHREERKPSDRDSHKNLNHMDEKRQSNCQRDSNHNKEKRHSSKDSQKDSNHRDEKSHSNGQKDSNHREEKTKEKRHSDRDSQIDSNHRVKESQSKQSDDHHESRSSSKSNDKDKLHKSSSRHAEKSNSSSSKSSSSKSSSKRHREEESSSKSQKKDDNSNDAKESSKRSNEPATDKQQPKAKKPKLIVSDGIDNTMGASFSDALGMCGIGGSSKKTKKLQKLVESKSTVEAPHHSKSVVEKQTMQTVDLVPEALKTSPKTKLDISLNLPIAPSVKISDNYKPSPVNQNVMNCIYPSSLPDKSAALNYNNLNLGITSKTMRTKVYSGVKTGALLSVPSLFDICIRILQKNIDALEYTGGVPFEVLKPVLERTTPQQLLNFEDYNAYLLEDTDALWKQHVGRNYRGKIREDGESWREMFLRCEDEKERRLSILTKNIKISQTQSALPIKKTRLAYVDNVVKPPRNIQRKQELNGTYGKLTASPAARVAALSAVTHNTVVAGDPRLKIAREVAAPTSNNSLKVKKAPLMAKTLQFIKKTYKR